MCIIVCASGEINEIKDINDVIVINSELSSKYPSNPYGAYIIITKTVPDVVYFDNFIINATHVTINCTVNIPTCHKRLFTFTGGYDCNIFCNVSDYVYDKINCFLSTKRNIESTAGNPVGSSKCNNVYNMDNMNNNNYMTRRRYVHHRTAYYLTVPTENQNYTVHQQYAITEDEHLKQLNDFRYKIIICIICVICGLFMYIKN